MPPSDLPDEPVLLTTMSDDGLERWRAGLGRFHVGVVDGGAATTEAGLFEQLAAAFAAPAHFGANWDALHDVLGDLSWLDADGFLVIVDHADVLLRDGRDGSFDTFLDVMSSLARLWADGGGTGERRRLVFRTLLRAPDAGALAALEARAAGAGADTAVVDA